MFGDKNYKDHDNFKLRRSISMESERIWKETRLKGKINKEQNIFFGKQYATTCNNALLYLRFKIKDKGFHIGSEGLSDVER